jgi:protein CpxP
MNSIRKLLAGSLLAGAVLAVAAVSISIATAADEPAASAPAGGPGGWHHHHHRHGHGHWMLSKLNLSDAQKAQVKTIMQAAGPQMRSIHQQMRANSEKLSDVAPTDGSHASVMAEVSQANAALYAQMLTQKETVRASIYKILTPAQQQQLATLKAEMKAKMAARQQAWAASHPQGTAQ